MSGPFKYLPVLIVGASPRVSIPVARALNRRGIPVDVASFQPEEPNLRSRAIREFHRLPSRLDSGALKSALIDLVRTQGFDTIFAAGDPSLSLLADMHQELGALATLGCPSPRAVERVLNKSLTLEAAQQCGIRAPYTCTVLGINELDSVAARLRFPLVAKPEKKGAASFRIFYFSNLVDLSRALQANDWGRVLLQEYCAGVGVGIELLISKGECIAKFQHRRLREAPVTGGVAVVAVSERPDPALLESSIALLRALEWEGVAMVEFRVDRASGSSALMEVNGRFWGSVSLPIMAGVDFPFYYWQLLHGERPNVPQHYRVGLRWRWSSGYVDRFLSMLFRSGRVDLPDSNIRESQRSPGGFSFFTKEALWSWSDPVPFLAETGSMLGSLIRAVSKSVFRKVAPPKLRTHLSIYSRLEPQARSRYARLRVRDAVGLQARNGNLAINAVSEKVSSVLFVCYGNLMRSPMAEAMLKHVLAERGISDVTVRSAGLHAVPGRGAHTRAISVSRELGMPLDEHRAQAVTPELVASSDLILGMDYENLAELETFYPEAKHKILLLSSYAAGIQRNREIADPYFGDLEATRHCYTSIRSCVDSLARNIGSSPAISVSSGKTREEDR